MPSCIRGITCTIFLSFFLTPGAWLPAQTPVDVLVSPPLRSSTLFPNLQEQAVATIDHTTLAVWISTTNHAADSLVVTVQMQLLRDGVPSGPQQAVSEIGYIQNSLLAAAPRLQVVAARDAFLVIWTDVASYDVHARRVSLDGELLDTTWTVGDQNTRPIGSEPYRVVGDPSLGEAILWNQAIGVTAALHVDPDATSHGLVDPLGGPFDQIFTSSQIPGIFLIHFDRRYGGGGRIIRRDGSVVSGSLPLGKEVLSFCIVPDSSLATLSPQQGIRIYRSMFDSIPSKTVQIGALDSAYKDAVALARVSSGDYDICFAVVSIIPYDPSQSAPYHRRIAFYRVRCSPDGTLSAPVMIYENKTTVDKEDAVIFAGPAVRSIEGNANTHLIGLDFPTTVHYGTDSAQQRTTSFEFSVDSTGHFKFDRSYGTSYENRDDSPSGYLPAGEPVDRSTMIARVPSDTASRVRVTVFGHSTDLIASAGSYTVSTSRIDPVIYNLNGDLLVSWQRGGRLDVGQWIGGTFDLARWSGTGEIAVTLDSAVLDTLVPLPPDPLRADSLTKTTNQNTLVRVAPVGLPAVLLWEKRWDDVTYRSSEETVRGFQTVQTRGSLNVATPEGWKNIAELGTSGVSPNDSDVWFHGVGWNPNDRSVAAVYGIDPGTAATLISFQIGLPTPVTSDAVTERGSIIPVGGAEYLVAQEDSLFDYNGARRTGSFAIPMVPDGVTEHRRLLGPRFLRATLSTPGTLYTLERFDFTGNRLSSTSITFPASISATYLFQDDRDSTLILLYISNGIRMARLTQDLHLLFSDSLIIAPSAASMPAGAVRNDTLFVIWANQIDHSIHGTWTRLPEQHGSTSGVRAPAAAESGEGVTISGLAPNPARDYVTVEWRARAGTNATIEVIDRLGRVVARQSVPAEGPGMHATRVVTSGLESGTYMLRLRNGEGEAGTGMIVVH